MTTKEVKNKIKELGYNASDFSVRKNMGLTAGIFNIKATHEELTEDDFKKVESAFPFESVAVWDVNNRSKLWNW